MSSAMLLLSCLVAACVFGSGLGSDDAYAPAAAAAAATAPVKASSSSAESSSTPYYQPVVGAKLIFHGYYAGICAQDGFYVNGPYSLVVCSNGRAHVQPCAPGTRNAAVRAYVPGVAYQYTDFCNENLNDYAGKVVASIPYYPVYPYGPYYAGYPYVY